MVNFLTQIPDCHSHSPALLDLFISSDASICSTIHVVVSVSIDFPINSKRYALFHCAAYDYSRVDWDDLCNHLREFHGKITLTSMLLLLVKLDRVLFSRLLEGLIGGPCQIHIEEFN